MKKYERTLLWAENCEKEFGKDDPVAKMLREQGERAKGMDERGRWSANPDSSNVGRPVHEAKLHPHPSVK